MHEHDVTRLTRKELSILSLVAEGLTSAEIAKTLAYSTGYIENVLAEIREKLEARNLAHAVAIALSRGWIDPNVR